MFKYQIWTRNPTMYPPRVLSGTVKKYVDNVTDRNTNSGTLDWKVTKISVTGGSIQVKHRQTVQC